MIGRRKEVSATADSSHPGNRHTQIAHVVWVVAVLLSAPGFVRAQAGDQGAAAGAATPTPPSASQLTLDTIGEQAEVVEAKLRSMTEDMADPSFILALENDVFQYHQRVAYLWTETDRLLVQTPRRTSLEALASSWRALRTQIGDLQPVVDERMRLREADLQTLDRLRASWSWTLDHARQVAAPSTIISHIEATLAAIDATRARFEKRDARLLVLQDALSRSAEAYDQAAARIEDARRQAVARVFVQNQLPIWNFRTATEAQDVGSGALARLTQQFAPSIDSLRIYLQAYRRGFIVTLLLFLVLSLVLYRARRRVARDAKGDASLPESVTDVLRAPLSAALLLTLLVSRPLRPDPPLALAWVVLFMTFPAALVLLRPLADPRLVPALFALGLLLVIEVGRGLLQTTPVLEQIVLLLEMSACAALLFWVVARLPTSGGALARRLPWLRTAGRALFRAVALAAVAAAVAAALGYLELADLVGGGGLTLVYVTITLLGIRIAAGGVLVFALAHTPLARLHSIRGRGARVERAIGRVLDVVVVVFWVFTALRLFELLAPVNAALQGALDAHLQVGQLDLAVSQVLGFVGVVLVAWLVARITVFALEEDVYPRLALPRGVPYALSTLLRYGLLLAGFFLALATLGLDLTRLTVLVSAFGLGIGFGMQEIINNFVSGLILLFERPVQVGDSVQLGDLSGQMLRIGIRSSTIRTGDGAEVIVPNAKLITERVTNWTLSDRKRRVDLALRVPSETEAQHVLALLLEVAERDPRVMKDPEPESLFTGFADTALEYQLRVWTEDPRWMRLRSDLGVAIQEALRTAQIALPHK